MGIQTVDCPEIKIVYLAVTKSGGVFQIHFTCVEVAVMAEGHYVAW